MTIRVLPGLPDKVSETTEPKVRRMTYGDGYEQVRRDGLNHQLRAWKVSYGQQRGDVIDIVRDFVISTGGTEAFHFLPPGASAPALVRVDGSFNRDYQHQDAVVDFSLSLREVLL